MDTQRAHLDGGPAAQRRAAEAGADAFEEIFRPEGPGHVVVGAEAQRVDLAGRVDGTQNCPVAPAGFECPANGSAGGTAGVVFATDCTP